MSGLTFNRYDLEKVVGDKYRVATLLQFARLYGKESKLVLMTIYTPAKRRGDYESRDIRHYDLDSVIEHYEKQVTKTKSMFYEAWKQSLSEFVKLREYLINK